MFCLQNNNNVGYISSHKTSLSISCVQAALSDDNLYTCVTGWVSDVFSDNEDCVTSYSSDDMAAIQGLAVGAGHIECFHDIFHGACAEYAGCA